MIAHYRKILKDAEKRVARSMEIQVKGRGIFQGGFSDGHGLVHGKFSIYRVTTAIAAYCNRDSVFYQDKQVLEMIMAGLSYIGRCQHENGLFDYIDCNFDSAPDTAFCIKRLLPVVHYLETHQDTSEEKNMYESIREIVQKGARGILSGGFHTPNHRWAIASNLMECGKLFQDEEMIQGAERYLRETIDCNDDGEYTEKSAGNYNRINNDAMLTLGDTTGEEIYYDHAVRNLTMMITYLEPDGSIFTSNSTRQDRGKAIYPRDYYMNYLILGYEKQIPEFLCMANRIMELVEEKQMLAPDCLIQLMNRPELIAVEYDNNTVIEEYEKFYKDSGIVRVRHPEYAYTIMKGSSGFLFFRGKKLSMQIKVCGSFFRHRAFQPEVLQQQNAGYHLEQQMQGSYYLPLGEEQGICDNWEKCLEKRGRIQGPELKIDADIEKIPEGVEVHLKICGVQGAPFRVEFELTGADWMWNGSAAVPAAAGGFGIKQSGNVYFSNDEETIEIGQGFGKHLYTDGRFGSETHSKQAFTLFFTDYTEFEHTIRICFYNHGMIRMGENTDERD